MRTNIRLWTGLRAAGIGEINRNVGIGCIGYIGPIGHIGTTDGRRQL